ncbi:MAG TPA: hypothetical protein VHV74_14695 [Pseudonocardiaceae bacterium]|nr:hypothetical protein [Pseudonocardiaceae bacterium]
MNSATDGDTDYLAVEYLRRPISVAELLEREGYTPAGRRAARRALCGVTAGAVLALGAVVGTLFFHGERTAGDSLASGGLAQSGGDIVLAETSSGPAAATPRQVVAPKVAPAPKMAKAAPKAGLVPGSRVGRDDISWGQGGTGPVGAAPGGSAPVAPAPQGTAGAMAPSTTIDSATAPAQPTTQSLQSQPATTTTPPPTDNGTASTPPTDTSTPPTDTSVPSTTDAPATTTPAAPPTTTGHGLVGGLAGALGNVTSPVFSWFG